MVSRRKFLSSSLAGAATAYAAIAIKPAFANIDAKVVVVGGGTAGVAVARILRQLSKKLHITLIEKNPYYLTCYMSNEVIVGKRKLDSLQFAYDKLRTEGINVVIDEVVDIDSDEQTVSTQQGKSYAYDRCIVAPGVDFRFDEIEGHSKEASRIIPHAWQAGEQTLILQRQLLAMRDGGTVLLVAPDGAHRCPAAPYERASLIAQYIQTHKPKSKIIILDAKSQFPRQADIQQGWKQYYNFGEQDSTIDWISGVENYPVLLDVKNKRLETEFGDAFQADVMNLIPRQKAGRLAFKAGLVADNGWCPVDKRTFESTQLKNIHVIGDAADARVLPKTASAAHSSAHVCAEAIVALLSGNPINSTPAFRNSCYAIVNDDYAVGILASYHLAEGGEDILIDKALDHEAALTKEAFFALRKSQVQHSHDWYQQFTKNLFD